MRALMNKQLLDAQTKLLSRLLFDKSYALACGQHPLHARILDYITPDTGKRVLELGCGPGKYVALMSSTGFDVVGVDPHSFPAWEIIKANTSALLLDKIVAESLPFPDGSFDHVVCLGALLYFDNPGLALAEARRVLKPDGKLLLRTVNKNNLYTLRTGRRLDPASRQLYSMDELKKLLQENGFIVTDSFSYGFWPPAFTDIWWYLICVWVPIRVQDWLSDRLTPERRVNNVIFALPSQE